MAVKVAGQNGRTFLILNAPQEMAELYIGISVADVFDLPALAEEAVRLIEEKDHALVIGSIEEGIEILFRLANVFADEAAEVDAEKRKIESSGPNPRPALKVKN